MAEASTRILFTGEQVLDLLDIVMLKKTFVMKWMKYSSREVTMSWVCREGYRRWRKVSQNNCH
jgi:hypothetical protein